MNIKKLLGKAGVVAGGVVAAGSAMAQTAAPATVQDLASSVSFSDVGIAVLAIAGALIGVQVIIKGAKTVMAMVGGNR